MNDSATEIEKLFNLAEDYGNSTIELYKLEAIDKSADVVSSIVSRLVIFTIVALALLILNIGLALWLGMSMGTIYYGFVIIGAFYALFALLLFFFRQRLLKLPLSNSLIKQMLKQNMMSL